MNLPPKPQETPLADRNEDLDREIKAQVEQVHTYVLLQPRSYVLLHPHSFLGWGSAPSQCGSVSGTVLVSGGLARST